MIAKFWLALPLLILIMSHQASAQELNRCSDNLLRSETLDYLRGRVGNMFIHADKAVFSKGRLKALFKCLSDKHPNYVSLEIVVYSDRANLDIAMRNQKNPPPDFNPPLDSREHDCKNLQEAIRPCPYGYHRARYFRTNGREYFDYSPDPNQERLITVTLVKPEKKLRTKKN